MLLDPKWNEPKIVVDPLVKARTVLILAADYMDQHGLCQGAYMAMGMVCAFGAMQMVAPSSWTACNFDAPAKLLRDHLGLADNKAIVAWNDAPGRTKDEVVVALREAARS